ncbi:hypothetical protein GGR42_000997 [Saonia flava]|uniref:Uncharacterized protein n=1 Tax=Saonia flava TaxID=523696 RepID=A0A846QY22_9FLAO|nr:hypothetical protein [Saonia flava]NJB70535.1 hypothetical protein [Saonia flava]
MKNKFYPLVIVSFIFFQNVLAQNYYDIIIPGADRDQKCQQCLNIFNQKPKEVGFSIKKDQANNLYFEVNNKQWFNLLFKNPGDGIAIDVVSKERYDCEEIIIPESQIRGELLKPVYSAALKKTLKPYNGNIFRTRVGKLSEAYTNKDLEFNILFLSNKNLCRYYTIFDLEAYQWDLLDMGMYLDSLTYKTKLSATLDNDKYTLKYKEMSFTIPFKKNKSEYSQEDIKPVYDSLRLTDFNIKKINIKAYSSIEGNLERNMELQQQRAKSIVNALQTFQKPTITTEVSSSENWVEFLNDISGTQYANYKSLTKNEIKAKVVGAVSEDLEKYLKNHRKAVITMELERKDKYGDMTADVILGLFNEALGSDNLETAHELQNSIFERLKRKEIEPTFLDRMDIPEQLKYTPFFNKNSAFRYLMDERNLLIAYNQLLRLEKIAPNDKKVKYNIVALKMRIWRYNVEPVQQESFKKEIQSLKNYGINQKLINRMMVNYHIINSELFMRKNDYTNKDKSVDYIFSNYKNVPLNDYDYLSLSQYLSYYSNIQKAEKVLQDKVKNINVNENLLFYYLNLTLINEELTQDPEYRTIMLNAINMNKKRFCRLFNAFDDGGVTFQLLENDYLRDTYCENCIN